MLNIINIYWNDLTKEKQKEIVDIIGDDGNYDIYPIAIVEIENLDEENEK